MVESIWSIFPPVLAIIMVLLTRRVLLSLGVGIVTSALFINHFKIGSTLQSVWEAFKAVFIEESSLNTWNVYIIIFILLLGMITKFVAMMGGTQSFGDWMIKRVKTRFGAQLMTFVLGIALFIDDYFNSLTVGQIARPVTDKHRISRAKLAYIVDSTAAPVCVIAPVSSWGAYIIGLIATVFATHNFVDYTALSAFIYMIPMNFYVWATLGVVIVLAWKQSDFGLMRKHEEHAIETGQVVYTQVKNATSERKDKISQNGKITDLLVPIIVLFIATIAFIYWSGKQNTEAGSSLIDIFGEADVSLALLLGGAVSILITFIFFIRHVTSKELTGKDFIHGIISGGQSMVGAIFILIFAWAISDLIGELGTGAYLAEVVKNSNISFALLPFILFVMAGFIAFSTGTSWGSFALLLPIAGQVAAATNMDLMLPMLAAVLAGAVFGDHCSPISDTTILSATGSNCHHIDHVMTQLPYALLSAGIAGAGYLMLGFTESILLGLLVVVIGLVILMFVLPKRSHQSSM